jgi:hypothetical protein
MKTPLLLPILVMIAIATSASAHARKETRDEIHRLAEKAKQAKNEGRLDEADELMRQVKKLVATAGGHEGEKPGDEARGDRLARMKQEIADLHHAGKHEEAGRLQQRFMEARSREHGGGPPHAGGKGPERVRHVMEAVQHLRAAGLNEPADDLERQARRMREEIERHQRESGGDRKKEGEPSPGEVHQLREQVERLSRELEETREELKRQRSDAGKKE